MPRKNPDAFPEDIQKLVYKLSQLSAENVVRKEIVLADEKSAKKVKYMVYSYLGALETWKRQGDEVLRKNRLIALYFKRNYGLSHTNRTLVFVPKSDPIPGAENLRELIDQVSQIVASQPDVGSAPLLEPDVGVPRAEGQALMEHLREGAQSKELDFTKLFDKPTERSEVSPSPTPSQEVGPFEQLATPTKP